MVEGLLAEAGSRNGRLSADDWAREALDQIAELYGPEATSPQQTWTRLWGTDPWTQGYVTTWRPGDVEAVVGAVQGQGAAQAGRAAPP